MISKKISRYALLALLIVMISFGSFTPLVSFAAFNKEVNYQGKLVNTSGVAVTNGDYNMVFKLYTVASGGTAIWTETRTGADVVTVTNGLFSIMLGEVDSLDGIDFDQPLYLGVNIGGIGSPSWDGEMTPRKELGAVAAAVEAYNLGGASSTQYLRSDIPTTSSVSSASTGLSVQQNGAGNILDLFDGSSKVFTVLDGGNVGIGTSSPYAKLSVVGNGVFTGTVSASNLSGTNSGDVTVAGETYLSIAGQVITAANINLGSHVTGTLLVANGGTGATTLTGILKGNGTSAVTAVTGTTNYVTRWTDANTLGIGTLYDNGTNVGVGTASPGSYKLNVAGDLYASNFNQKSFSLAVPTTIGDATEFATVTNTNFSSNVELWFTVHSGGYAQSKRYIVPVQYDGTSGAWQKALPISSTGAYSSNDADIDVKISANIATFRVRRIAGATSGTASITLAIGGDTSGTTIATASTGYTGQTVSVNYAPTSLTMKSGKTGINNDAPTAFLDILGTSEQFRTGYNSSNYLSTTISSSGTATFNAVGSDPKFNFTGGNVGIGITNPSYLFDVNGTSRHTGVSLFTNTTAATNITTGAIVSSGGIAAPNIYIGANTGSGSSGNIATFGQNTSLTSATGIFGDIRNVGTGLTTGINMTALGTGGNTISSLFNARAIPPVSTTYSYARAVQGHAYSNGAGTITDATNFYSQAITTSSGIITNAYGLYVEANTAATNNYAVYTAGTTKSYFGGNVGIGTSSPYAKLSVTNTESIPSFVVEDSASPDASPFIITAAGNVGIGSTTPSEKLSVDGNFALTGNMVTNGNLTFDYSGGSDGIFGYSSAGNQIMSITRQNTPANASLAINSYGAIGFTSNNTSGLPSTSYNMLIATDGNVGIGTTSPYAKLSVAGNGAFDGTVLASSFVGTGTATSTFGGGFNIATGCYAIGGTCLGGGSGTVNSGTSGYLAYYSSTGTAVDDASTLFWDNSNGRLGIGNASPSANLTVSGSGSQTDVVITTDTNIGSANTATLQFISDFDGTQNVAMFGQFNDGSLRLSGGSSIVNPDLIITDAGYVGIGTSSPLATFHVDGNARVDGSLSLSTSTNALIIGDITGNARGVDSIDIQKTRTADTQVASGDRSIVLGLNSGAGYEGLALGKGAAAGTIGGNWNIAIGAGASAYGGHNNIAVGTGATAYGQDNTFVGNNVNISGASNNNNTIVGAGHTISNGATATSLLNIFGYGNTVGSGSTLTKNLVVGSGNNSTVSGASIIGNDITNSTGSSLMIGPSDTAKLTILQSGNVGIGTTSPYAKLSVAGNGAFDGTVLASSFVGTSTATSTFGGGLNITSGCFALNGSCLQASSGTNTGDVTLAGENYLSLVGQVLTAADVNLTTNVTGTLPVANGGTGATSLTNLITLGTHTTGNYVASVTGGTGITVTGTAAEGWTPSVAITADAIGDTQLAFNTGQNLTTASSPTFAGITLTTDLSVANGGTGASSLTGVLKGNGASAFTAMTGTTNMVTRWTDANTLGTGVIYDTGTNIGIGTSSPFAKLSVVGNIFGSAQASFGNTGNRAVFSNQTAASPVGYFESDYGVSFSGYTIPNSTAHIINGTTGDIGYFSNTNQTVVLVPGSGGYAATFMGGNVGVGTTSPYAKLSVAGTVVGQNFIATSTTATSTFTGATFATSGGNVGIGTLTPNKKLVVSGSFSLANILGTNTAGDMLILGDVSSFAGFMMGNGAYLTSGIKGFINSTDGSFAFDNGLITSDGSGKITTGSLDIGSLSGILTASGGNVSASTLLGVTVGGSGATSLTGVLKGNGTSAFTGMTGTTNYVTRWTDANTLGTGILTDTGTYVGIGISTTLSKFAVNSGGSGYAGLFTDSSWGNELSIQLQSASNAHIVAGVGDSLGLGANGTREYLTIGTTGNVGVGTTSPYAKLSVAGTVVANNYIATGTATSTFVGAVSIGDPNISLAYIKDGRAGFGAAYINYNLSTYALDVANIARISQNSGNGNILTLESTEGTPYAGLLLNHNGGTASIYGYQDNSLHFDPGTGGDSIFESGNVGIGTSVATDKLHIEGGDIRWADPLANMDFNFVRGGGSNSGIGFYGSVMGANISGALTSNAPTIYTNNGGMQSAAAIHFGPDNSAAGKAFGIWTGTGTAGTALTQKFTVTNTGNVGVGTSSPYEKLSVAGTIVGQNFVGTSTTASQFGGDILLTNSAPLIAINTNDGADNKYLSLSGGGASGSNRGANIFLEGNEYTTNYKGRLILAAGNVAGTIQDGAISFWTDNSLERMTITRAGNVGVGTTSPAEKFTVSGNAMVTGSLSLNGGTLPSGVTFGINPGSITDSNLPVQINGSVGSSINYLGINQPGNNAQYGLLIGYDLASFGGGGVIRNVASTPIAFVVNNTTQAMTILSNGNVGIATTTPYAKLSVAGHVTGEYFTSTSASATTTINGGLTVGNNAIKYDWSTGVTSIDNLELGAFSFDADGGIISWADMPVTSSASSGTVQSYSAQLDGNAVLTVYGTSDGSGGVTNLGVGIGTTSPYGRLSIQTSSASNVGVVIKGSASQTANLSEWRNSSGTIVASVNASGVGSFTSSIDFKENFTELDKEELLEKIEALRITEWNYKTEATTTKHIGPIAEQFHELFGLNGEDNKHITTIDPAGIALAGVQALSVKLNSVIDKVVDGVAYLKYIVVEGLTIGSTEKPSGITMFDEITGEPYCFKIRNGQAVTTSGECSLTTESESVEEDDVVEDTPTPDPISIPDITTSTTTSTTTDNSLIDVEATSTPTSTPEVIELPEADEPIIEDETPEEAEETPSPSVEEIVEPTIEETPNESTIPEETETVPEPETVVEEVVTP